jgi:dihydroorotate dehydrogenase electron transfer subunit
MIHNAATYIAELVSKREIIPGTFSFVLHAPVLAQKSRPGQFVMIQVHESTDPLLRRPISLSGAGDDTVELLFQVTGRGTQLMADWEPGRSVNLLGPLGNGFTIPDTIKAAVLVAGGIGAAPLLYLAKQLAGYIALQREFFFGAKTGQERALVEGYLLNEDFQYVFVSEDGTTEFQGFVTEAFAGRLCRNKIDSAGTCIFSCGPEPMLRRVSELAYAHNMPCQVSLEAHMACGVGACLGCVRATVDGYKRVCADGPVFHSKDIVWSHD